MNTRWLIVIVGVVVVGAAVFYLQRRSANDFDIPRSGTATIETITLRDGEVVIDPALIEEAREELGQEEVLDALDDIQAHDYNLLF